MKHEFRIGEITVTVDGVPEGLEPNVDVNFHLLSVTDTARLVDALGGVDALGPVYAGAVCLTARDGAEFGAPSCEISAFPRDPDKGDRRARPSNPVVRSFWEAQQEAARG